MDVLRRWTVGQIGQDTYSREDRDNYNGDCIRYVGATDKLRDNSKRDTSSSLPGKMCRK